MAVLYCGQLPPGALAKMLARYGLQLCQVEAGQAIPGSYWGDSEAGLIGRQLFIRADTPVHSALHEACHYICMSPARRARLHTDAGGSNAEECAVCYLQIILADYLPEVGQARLLADMDEWGYSFRLGSARRWFEEDASEARAWLLAHELLDQAGRPSWQLRGAIQETVA